MRALLLFLVGLLTGACATLGSPAGGTSGFPSSSAGPFRTLTTTENPTTPFVLDGAGLPYREPSALAVDPTNAASSNVYLYLDASITTTTMTSDVIARTRADDARTFYGAALDDSNGPTHPAVVLTASLAWEGGEGSAVSGPSALRVQDEIWLYYAAAGGIGLARSPDGLTFTKEPSPVLAPDPEARWETTTPSAPSVAVLPDGTYDMMYAAGSSIGEATSPDGVHFTRVDGDPSTPALDPVLSPLPSSGLSSLDASSGDASDGGDAGQGPFDTGQVSDPCVVPVVTPAGRLDIHVFYTGYDGPPSSSTRSSAIGLAARYGTGGPLVRAGSPVFSLNLHEAAPTYFMWSLGEMLYVHAQTGGGLGGTPYDAIASGFAPPQVTLPPPQPYASSP